MNPLARLLLGEGRLPEALEADLTREGLVLHLPGLVGSVSYRDFRTRDGRTARGRQAASGTVAITRDRLVVWAARFKHVDVPLTHPLRQAVVVAEERPGLLLVGYDAGLTNPERSGQVEVRLRTPQAADVVRLSVPG